MRLYTYFRSSASYRVRIALGLKGIATEQRYVHLTKDGGEQHRPDFMELNPEQLVPVLTDDDKTLTQSLAILEYLEEKHPLPALLPLMEADRAWVRSLALQVACEIHPLNNLRVLQYLDGTLRVSSEQKQAWIEHWTRLGLAAVEEHLVRDARTGRCCFGDSPGLADCCLVPQLFNARRFGIALDAYPTLVRIDSHLKTLEPFQRAAPGLQRDAQ